jgi:hypothetical protein
MTSSLAAPENSDNQKPQQKKKITANPGIFFSDFSAMEPA